MKRLSLQKCVFFVARYSSSTFRSCKSLESVTIPRGVTEIGKGAFEDCTSLKSVSIPRSVTKIDDYAFGYVFGGCDNLTVQYDGTKAQWEAIKKGGDWGGLRHRQVCRPLL